MDTNLSAGSPRADEPRLTGFWRKLRACFRRVPFAEEAAAAYFCANDPNTPTQVKAVIVGALAYFVMPADLVPDFLVGLGFTDDAAVFWAAWQSVSRHVSESHRELARRALSRP
ncbi:MAG TPA: DUF1232 domain-containing protein [Rhodospirillaceae bacterium]|nr:hypothetical protein [Rhodospirillaceae bacterium]HAA93312.1 DUF1232 domain-containing protein [Rhodospirillaceae bacterium]HAT35881.1 DUF1232 domain-containing protein [Rhodospirillaceae bacterium]